MSHPAPPDSRPDDPARRYNVLMLAPTMFYADYGAHVRILEEATSLRALGHRVTILAYPNGRDIAGLDVIRCWGVPFNYRIIVGSSRHRFYLDVMLSLKALATVPRLGPDILHAHLHEGALIGAVLSKLWRVPLIFDFQGSLTSEMLDHKWLKPDSPAYRPLYWLEKQIDRWPQAILTSSHNATALLRTEFGRSDGQVYTIPDSVDTNAFRPGTLTPQQRAELRAQYGIPADAQVVVYLGILQDYQGIPHLIRAAKRVVEQRPNTYFLLMGFPNQERYYGLAERVGVADHVRLPGMVPREENVSRLALGDIAAGPKLSATEGAGKLLCYMAMGLPVVAFDTPVSREYLGDLGVCAPPGSIEGLAEGILALLRDPDAARRRGRKLRERAVERYTWEQSGRQIAQIYKMVCPRPRSML
jgi:glycosyltransferase involved in cell wall biosynthesis